MKSNILIPNNISNIFLRNLNYGNDLYNPTTENTENKGTNTNLINANQRFDSINKNKKRENSYVYISPEQNLYEINKFKTKRTDSYNNNNVHYYLPLLPKNKKIVKRNNITDRKDVVSLLKNRNKIKRELIINPVSLDLNSMSNETRINKNLQNKNHRNKVRDNFMEKVKDYRRRLKEQMIKRNKFQYSHSNSINKSHNYINDKESLNENLKEKEKIGEKINIKKRIFNYEYTNNYLNYINNNVDNALNKFYGKNKSSRISIYDKADINLPRVNSKKYLLYDETKNNNKFNTINVK